MNHRKICQHCKCPREDHNIIVDDARAGRSVFLGDVNYSGFPSDDDSGCALDEYAWVPPGLNAEQVGEDNKKSLCCQKNINFLNLTLAKSTIMQSLTYDICTVIHFGFVDP